MSWVSSVSFESASDEVKEFLENRRHLLENKKLAIIFQNMEVFNSLEGSADRLDAETQKKVGKREGDLIEYVISRGNKAPFCEPVYANVLERDHGITDLDTAELSERDKLIIEFAQAFVTDFHHLPESLKERMKAEYTDEQIVVLTALASIVMADNIFETALDIQY